MSITNPILIQQLEYLLMDPKLEKQPLIEKGKLSLAAIEISGKSYLLKKFQTMLQTLSQVPEDKVQSRITNRPVRSRKASTVGNKLIPLGEL